ncbi:hypothetical protein ECA2983 [Pectobacterium atrosepticum SCRI1043]|uniref:Uncharacterized protein n=1 Tax=Pectobacterium atrosepticum (strain SCRI 1043 / ATCC BAA-672) TaxID=218491 RepID=Q6D2W1_PECAS|nr:hypothetical protein ECA2983 [Pectobacterium atrosepticum SCRI1043]
MLCFPLRTGQDHADDDVCKGYNKERLKGSMTAKTWVIRVPMIGHPKSDVTSMSQRD